MTRARRREKKTGRSRCLFLDGTYLVAAPRVRYFHLSVSHAQEVHPHRPASERRLYLDGELLHAELAEVLELGHLERNGRVAVKLSAQRTT